VGEIAVRQSQYRSTKKVQRGHSWHQIWHRRTTPAIDARKPDAAVGLSVRRWSMKDSNLRPHGCEDCSNRAVFGGLRTDSSRFPFLAADVASYFRRLPPGFWTHLDSSNRWSATSGREQVEEHKQNRGRHNRVLHSCLSADRRQRQRESRVPDGAHFALVIAG
jgi:hypothetical protein